MPGCLIEITRSKSTRNVHNVSKIILLLQSIKENKNAE